METWRVLTLASAVFAVMFGTCATVRAQTAAPTPAPAPTNPNWCPGVPESPPPPGWSASDWAGFYKSCSSTGLPRSALIGCSHVCNGARAAWATSHNAPPANRYLSTSRPQGPIPLPGGGEGYILPLLPPPGPPGASPMPSAPQGSSDPPGLVPGAFAGADLNALNDGQPPDVAADVSPTQNVEFVNFLGLYIWAKPALPILSPAPTPEATVSINGLWCTGNGANGSPLSGCSSNGDGTLASGYNLADPQVGYDISLGR